MLQKNEQKVIAHNTKALHADAHLIQRQLGARSGLGWKAISQHEAGRTAPNPRDVCRLAKLLEATSDDIYGWRGS